jgi:acyl-CoA thioesterase-1
LPSPSANIIISCTIRLLSILFLALPLLAGCNRGPAPDATRTDQAARDSAASAVAAQNPATQAPDSLPVILFLGNSLTAGYGLTPEEAFPALIQEKLDSAGYHYRVVNAGISGETSAGGVRRVDWLLQNPVAILVLELGANDALRGHDLRATRVNLQTIIDRTRALDPRIEVVIAGMQAPPNLGSSYTEAFRQLFFDLAHENDAALIPFLLEGVGGIPELNQADGIHPTAEGHTIMAENVWRVLVNVIGRPEA